MMPKSNGAIARKQRQEAAQKRLGEGSPTPEKQLEILDSRLGKGRGAKKERARLKALIVENEK